MPRILSVLFCKSCASGWFILIATRLVTLSVNRFLLLLLFQGHIETQEDASILKVALKSAQQALLEEIESLERSLDQQISELQNRKSQIAMKKRTHRKCMVHLVSCYKK